MRSEKRERGRWEWVGGEGGRGRERWGGRRVGGREIRTGRKEPRRGGPFIVWTFFSTFAPAVVSSFGSIVATFIFVS